MNNNSTDKGLTVVIPVRNRENLVIRCLDSVKRQTLRPLNVIVVDNGSTDGTWKAVEGWIARNAEPEFAISLISEPKPGASRARNRGLSETDTEHVMFFDSDDEMDPTLAEGIMTAFRDSRVDLVHWNARIINPDGSVKKRKFSNANYWRYQIYHALFSAQCFAVKTSFLRDIGGWDDSLYAWNDWELGIRMLLGNPAMIAIDKALVTIHPQKVSITGENFHSKAGEWERAIDRAEENVVKAVRNDSGWLADMINYRRAILAAHYKREGHQELAEPLLAKALSHPSLSFSQRHLLKLLYRYTSIGGRGAYILWK